MLDNLNDFSPTSSLTSCVGATQLELEYLYSKYQLLPTMREDFSVDFQEPLLDSDIPVEFGLDLLVHACLHKRADVSTMVGILKNHFEDELDAMGEVIKTKEQLCADMLLKAAEEDLVDVDTLQMKIVYRYDISPETQEKIDRFQYPLPMIEPPRPVKNNRDTGYRTIKGSIILKKNHHEDDVCLDHIDRVNSIPLALNKDVVAFIQNSWKNLDKRKDGETSEDFRKRKKAFQKYDRTSRDVIDAMLLHSEEGFYLTHKYDKRGRTYAQGYHINYQSNDWCKACVELAHAEPLRKD